MTPKLPAIPAIACVMLLAGCAQADEEVAVPADEQVVGTWEGPDGDGLVEFRPDHSVVVENLPTSVVEDFGLKAALPASGTWSVEEPLNRPSVVLTFSSKWDDATFLVRWEADELVLYDWIGDADAGVLYDLRRSD